jgi:DUF2934 family protein
LVPTKIRAACVQEVTAMLRVNVPPAFIILSTEEIAERAYAMYLARGCAEGGDREDWFAAERELRARTDPALSRRSLPRR